MSSEFHYNGLNKRKDHIGNNFLRAQTPYDNVQTPEDTDRETISYQSLESALMSESQLEIERPELRHLLSIIQVIDQECGGDSEDPENPGETNRYRRELAALCLHDGGYSNAFILTTLRLEPIRLKALLANRFTDPTLDYARRMIREKTQHYSFRQ